MFKQITPMQLYIVFGTSKCVCGPHVLITYGVHIRAGTPQQQLQLLSNQNNNVTLAGRVVVCVTKALCSRPSENAKHGGSYRVTGVERE